MNNSPGLTDPCPCGSGKSYKRCCFRRRNKQSRKRRRKKKRKGHRRKSSDGGQKSENYNEKSNRDRSSGSGPKQPLSPPVPPAPPEPVAKFSETLEQAYWAHNEAYPPGEPNPFERFIEAVGAISPSVPDQFRTALQVQAVLGDEALGGERETLADCLEEQFGPECRRLYETHRNAASLTVYRRNVNTGFITPVHGASQPRVRVHFESVPQHVAAFDGLFVGHVLRFDDATMLFGADRLDGARAETYRAAAQRSAWGASPETFRRLDFEADLLLLLLDPKSEDSGTREGRVLRGQYADHPQIADADAALELLESFVDDKIPVADGDELQHEYWPVAFALAEDARALTPFAESIDEIRTRIPVFEVFHSFRRKTGKTREAEFSTETFLEWLGITRNGGIELAPNRDWRSHPVDVLELDPAFKRRHDLQDDWPLEFARKRLDERGRKDGPDTFERALRLHRRRLRWLTLMERWRKEAVRSPARFRGIPYQPILTDWIAGLRTFFEESLYRRKISELPEQNGRFRSRLERQLRTQRGVDAPARICDVPASSRELKSISGIGGKTVQRYIRAIEAVVSGWEPEEAARSASTPGPSAADDHSRQKIDRGLDALDDLFA